MAHLGEDFEVASLPQSDRNFDPLPAGWYTASITNAELTPTKNGTGQYIKMRYDITGPSHQGRVVFSNLNIRNANPKAEEIGRQQLGELARSIGLARVSDTDQLIGGQVQIKLSIQAARDGYDASNDVKGFKSISGSAAPTSFAAPPVPAPAAPAAASPPWAKK